MCTGASSVQVKTEPGISQHESVCSKLSYATCGKVWFSTKSYAELLLAQ